MGLFQIRGGVKIENSQWQLDTLGWVKSGQVRSSALTLVQGK